MSKKHSPYRTVIIAATVGLLATIVVIAFSQIRFAYRNPELRLFLQTVEGLIALLVAYLMWGRFTRNRSESDLVLVFSLAILGISSLAFSVLPDVVGVGPRDVLRTWVPITTRFVGGVALALAAMLPHRRTLNPLTSLRVLFGALVVTFGVVVISTIAFEASLPHVIESELTAEGSGRPDLSANSTFTVIQLILLVPYALASFGFLRRFRLSGDDLMRWLAAGSILSAFARTQYALYPSLYSDFLYSGDILRLGFYLLLLVGATREMKAHWESVTQATILEERRRLAFDLHDGIAQEMTFLSGQLAMLEREPSRDPALLTRIRGATDRAVAETRRSINALHGEVHQPLDVALREIAMQVFPNEPPRLDLALEGGIVVPPRRRERIVRVVREALTNARIHADATTVTLTMAATGDGFSVTVTDDGRGFDTTAEQTGFGLLSMEERVRNLGGRFSVSSDAGEGTTVKVVFDE